MFSTWSGAVTLDEALAHHESLRSDPDFEPHLCQLSDARGVTSAVTSEGVQEIARKSPFGAGSRRAIVVDSDLVYGVSRIYQARADQVGSEVRVFREIDEALAWIDPSPGEV